MQPPRVRREPRQPANAVCPPSAGHASAAQGAQTEEEDVGKRFIVVDDHPIIQRAMGEVLEELAEGTEVRYASRLADAMRILRSGERFDLILLDLRLPDAAGVESLVAMRELDPECTVAVMSADVDAPMIMRCLDLGALGYIPKTLSNEAIRNALRQVSSGCAYVPPQVLATDQPIRVRMEPGHARSSDPRHLGLTERQIDVLRLLLRGLPNKLICRHLALAEGTVKVHVSAVLRALGARNRTQAVIAASRIGLRFPE